MPRYYFNVYDGRADIDRNGTELVDIIAARAEAMRLAGAVIGDAGARGDLGEDWRFEVTDDAGLILFPLGLHRRGNGRDGQKKVGIAGRLL